MNIVGSYILPISLFFIMFSMGLSLTFGDFRRVFVHRRGLVLGVLSMMLMAPLVGVGIAWFVAPTAALAVGFILLATCPGGMVSNLMTDISKGDLALSLSMTIVVSFVYIFIIPFYAYFALQLFMGEAMTIEVPLWDFIWRIFRLTLIPVMLGLLVRHYRPAFAIAVRNYVKAIAMGALLVAFVMILINTIPTLRENFWTLFWMTLGMNLAVVTIAFFIARAGRLNPPQTSAICNEHLIRQEGTAIYIAVAIVGSAEMSLPMIMNTPVALAVCIIVVMLMRKHIVAHARQEKLAVGGAA